MSISSSSSSPDSIGGRSVPSLRHMSSWPPRCSTCGFKYTCATCVLYGIGSRLSIIHSEGDDGDDTDDTDHDGSPSPPRQSPSTLATERFPSPPPPPMKTVLCAICYNDVPAYPPPRKPTSRCRHDAFACPECMEKYVDGTLLDFGTFFCPMGECDQTMDYEDIKKFASDWAFNRFDEILTRKELQTSATFVWCKNPECKNGQYHIGGDTSNIVTCAQCGAKSCFSHDSPWHDGLTCAEYDRKINRVRERWREKMAMGWLAKKTKPCPKCSTPIEKTSGCDHMTCRPPGGCGYEFCWVCFANYDEILREGNHMHHRRCKFYTPLEGRRWLFWRR